MLSRAIAFIEVTLGAVVGISAAVLLLFQSLDWASIGRTWGPLGIIFVVAVVGSVAGAKAVKNIVLGTIQDARSERDYMRQQREREATAFIQSLKEQGEMMKDGFDEVLREVRSRRK